MAIDNHQHRNDMKKYILLLLLAVCTQFSAEGFGKDSIMKGTAQLNGKNISIWINITEEGTAEIGNGRNAAISQYAEGKLVIPANIVDETEKRRYRVTKVGNFAFSLCSRLTEVVLEEGITAIGEQAFSGCNGLKTVRCPASLTTIGRGAFMGCKNLKHDRLPENLSTMGQDAFVGNQFVDHQMLLPQGVTTIPSAAFEACNLKVVVLPSTLTNIEDEAFAQTGDCDFYRFDGTDAPTIADNSISAAGHWWATKPQIYGKNSFCNGLLPIRAMVQESEFTTENITYQMVQTGEYPGVFSVSAHRKSGESDWDSELKDLKTTVLHPSFPGQWKPEFKVLGIGPNFFSGSGIEKLHHIVLPASIEADQAQGAFAQCKALVSLDLSAMKPLSKEESDALLVGIPDNAVVYLPKGQTQEHRAYNAVLTQEDGQRRTSHLRISLNEAFDDLALAGNIDYRLPYSFLAEKATFYRSSFQNKKMETLVLPFTAQAHGKAFAFDRQQEETGGKKTMIFTKKEELQAHTPYLYKSDGTEISAENVMVNTPATETNLSEETNLYGSYTTGKVKALAAKQALNGAVFTFNTTGNKGNGAFEQADDNTEIIPFQAFFHFNDLHIGQKLRFLLEGEETTGIQNPTETENRNDALWFNLQGMKLNAQPRKGIYLQKGRKLLAR